MSERVMSPGKALEEVDNDSVGFNVTPDTLARLHY